MSEIDERLLRIGIADMEPIDVKSQRVGIEAYRADGDRPFDLCGDGSGQNVAQERRHGEETRRSVQKNYDEDRDTDATRAAGPPKRLRAGEPCSGVLWSCPKDVAHPRYPQSGIRRR